MKKPVDVMRIKSQTIIWAICLVMFIYVVMSFTIHKGTPKAVEKIRYGSLESANEKFLKKSEEAEIAEILQEELQNKKETFKVVPKLTPPKTNKHPVRHIAFLKVHKTASSTAQNVFLRYGDERNLSFVLAHTKGESGWLNVISYVNSITKANIVPAPKGQPFDLMCCHVIYDRKSFQSVLPSDTYYIGIVREPLSRFQSAVKYFSPRFILTIPGNNAVSVYAKNPLAYEPENPRQSQTNNRMAVEFGFPADLFPGKASSGSKSKINAYLQKIDKEFKFIIISELFDESMVLMKRILGWDTKDVLYMDKNVGAKVTNPKKTLHEEDHENVMKFLYLDNAVYDFAMERFNKLVKAGGSDFQGEVDNFKSERSKVTEFCSHSKAKQLSIDASEWHSGYIVTKHDCSSFGKHEKDLIQKQRMRMYGTLEN